MIAGPSFLAPYRRRRRSSGGSTVPPAPAAPDTPSSPSPGDAATAYYTRLSWMSARATKVDLYLDTVNPPATLVVPKYVGTSYVPTLLPGTTYYWKIVAFNGGGSAIGPVWSFTTPRVTDVLLELAGAVVTTRAQIPSLSVHEVHGPSPNHAELTFKGVPPAAGESVLIGEGTLDDDDLLFGGEVHSFNNTYTGTPNNDEWMVALVDHTFRINRRRPFGTWVNVSATVIAKYLVAVFAPGFTANHVQDALPAISINFDGQADFMTCLGRLATAISTLTSSGRSRLDYRRDVHLFIGADDDNPDALTADNPPLNDPPITFSVDHSQIRTRVYGKGHGEVTPGDVLAGETIVPIADAVMFNTGGGIAIVATTAGGAQTQIITYDGVQLGGGGSLVGPGIAPSVAPVLWWAGGAGLSDGTYLYEYTDVTAAGESLPSPPASIVLGTVPPPPAFTLTNLGFDASSQLTAGTYTYALTYVPVDVNGAVLPFETTQSATVSITVAAGDRVQMNIGGAILARTFRNAYRTAVGGTQLKALFLVNNNTVTTAIDPRADALLGANIPVVNTAIMNQVDVSGIALGASGTTQRKVYRGIANGTQPKLQQTIANNTVTTGVRDATADASLGANAPTGDTSGFQQQTGQVNAGSTSLLTASAAPFHANGGWATLPGGQTVRYTGISTNTLTGIPASGPGSITTTVLFGSQVLPAPALTGTNHNNGLTLPMAKGSSVNIWVQRDDLAAQAALGALELDQDGNPTDGIREYTITDERFGEELLIAACDADLAIFSRPIVSTVYTTLNRTRVGQTVSIDLSIGFFDSDFYDFSFYDGDLWGLSGDFTIQTVEIAFPYGLPRWSVTASSVAFTLSDLFRRAIIG